MVEKNQSKMNSFLKSTLGNDKFPVCLLASRAGTDIND